MTGWQEGFSYFSLLWLKQKHMKWKGNHYLQIKSHVWNEWVIGKTTILRIQMKRRGERGTRRRGGSRDHSISNTSLTYCFWIYHLVTASRWLETSTLTPMMGHALVAHFPRIILYSWWQFTYWRIGKHYYLYSDARKWFQRDWTFLTL